MKTRLALMSAVLLLALTGCASTAPTSTAKDEPASRAASEAEETATPEPSVAPTAPGEVCDPGNANDVICAAFYPDQAVLNIATRNEVLGTMDESAVLDLARQACEVMTSGGSYETQELAPGIDNRSIFSAAALAYCPAFAEGPEDYPDLTQRRLTYYQGIGEAAARSEFADGTMPTPEKLGY